MSETQIAGTSTAPRATATGVTISLWYALGVVAPLLVGVSASGWNWVIGAVAWVVSLVMLMLVNLRFDVELEQRNHVARRWRLAVVVLLVLAAMLGLLGLLVYLVAFFLAQVANGL